jgi:hypothetical protein
MYTGFFVTFVFFGLRDEPLTVKRNMIAEFHKR